MSSSDYMWDHEGLAGWLYRAADLDPHKAHPSTYLGESLLGPCSIEAVPKSLLYGNAQLVELPQAHLPGIWPSTANLYIWMRSKLDSVSRAWGIAHESAEFLVVRVARYQGEDIERYADATAAAILLPRPLVWSCVGPDLDLSLAEELRVTPACLALRWAEVLGENVAVVGPREVECRGFGWPEDPYELRQWAREEHWVWVEGRLRKLRKIDLGRRECLMMLG